MRLPGFVGPAYLSQNPSATSEKLLNFYPEKNESPGSKVPYVLVPTPGLTLNRTLSGAFGRGMFTNDGRVFAMSSGILYELQLGSETVLASSLPQGTQPASFASSGEAGGELFVITGREGYIYNLVTGGALSNVVSDVDFAGYLDGYFLALDAQTSTLKISNLLDGTTWGVGNVAQRDGAGDKWVAMLVTHQDIWLFGSETSEVWANVQASSTFPFALNGSAVLQSGTCAPLSVALLNNAPVWLSQSAQGAGMVLMANGYGDPQRISNHAIEQAIRSYAVITDAGAWTYEDAGHAFYVLTFPTQNVTWVYDVATDSWHERPFWNAALGRFEANRANCHVYAFGKHLVGDRASGAIYEIDPASDTDADDAPIRRIRRAPHLERFVFEVECSDPVPWRLTDAHVDIRAGLRRLFCDRFALDLETGIGLQSGQGANPQITLRVSTDGGRTFGNDLTRSAGAVGQYQTVVAWNRLGSAVTVG